MSIITNLLSLPASAAGVDLSDAARQLDGVLHRAGCKTLPVPDGLGYIEARGGLRAIATTMLESDTIARAVISQVRAAPFFGSVVVVVHPRPELDAPLCLLDLHVVPPGRARAYVDVCGPAIAHAKFRSTFWEPLKKALGTSSALYAQPVPTWMAALSGGCGAVVRARGSSANRLVGVSLNYLEAYLRGLALAPAAQSPAHNRESARAVVEAVRSNGKAGRMLERAFGASVASRYMRVLYNE